MEYNYNAALLQVQCNAHFYFTICDDSTAATPSNGFQDTCNAGNVQDASHRVSLYSL